MIQPVTKQTVLDLRPGSSQLLKMPFIITWGVRPHLPWLRQTPLSFASEPDRLAVLLELSGVSFFHLRLPASVGVICVQILHGL